MKTADEVIHELQRANIIFMVAGLGGGTGTGSIVGLAETLHRRTAGFSDGSVACRCSYVPFEVETARMAAAKKGFNRLKESCDTVVVIDNNRFVKVAGNLPFREALGVANTTVGKFVKGVTETITTASLINMDYADLKAIMTGSGLASIGIGEGHRRNTSGTSSGKSVKRTLTRHRRRHQSQRSTHPRIRRGRPDADRSQPSRRNHEAFTAAKTKIIWGARVNKELQAPSQSWPSSPA